MGSSSGAVASRTALVIQHLGFEDLGVLAPLLDARGYRIECFEPRTLDAAQALARSAQSGDLLIVLGGPIGVYEDDRYPFLATEKAIIRSWLAADRSILGICLGAQLIAEVLGAAVNSTGRKEIGYGPLTLTADGEHSVLSSLSIEGRDTTPVLHWHGDAFEIPAGAVRLAETPGFPNQAFAVGDTVLALQFHLEARPEDLELWLVGHAAELAAAGIDPRSIRTDAETFGGSLLGAAEIVFQRWLDALPA